MTDTTRPRSGNRTAIVISVAALVMSTGFAGGPALARALNADTVDHKHAVGAKASIKARKGKLVATDKRTGRLPDDIIGTAPRAKTAEHADTAARATSAGTADSATNATSAGNAAALGGKPGSAYLTKAEAAEVVGFANGRTLPPAGVITSGTTFTTTKAGRLLVDLTGSGQLQCPSSSFVLWWLQVDGTPIPSSALQLGEAVGITFDYNGFPAIHLAGITAAAVAAGPHTAALAGGCTSGSNGGSATTGLDGVGSVTVLPAGLAPSTAARHLARQSSARKACVATGSGRTCR